MRRLFFLALVALLLGAGIIALIGSEPGYLLLAYGNYTIESSLWVGLLLIAIIVILSYTAVRLLHRLLTSPGSLAFWVTSHRRRQASRLTGRGLMNFIEGHWKQSRRQLRRGARYSDAPAFNHLMAARASFQLEDGSQARNDLESALLADGQAAPAVDLVQAELQLQASQYGRALASLDRAESIGSRTPQSLRLRSKAMLGLSDWEGLRALLPELRRHEVLPAQELAGLRRETALRLLEVAAGDLGDNTVTALKRSWKQTPADLQDDDSVLHRYVELLVGAGASEEAMTLIARVLKKRWDSVLVGSSAACRGTIRSGSSRWRKAGWRVMKKSRRCCFAWDGWRPGSACGVRRGITLSAVSVPIAEQRPAPNSAGCSPPVVTTCRRAGISAPGWRCSMTDCPSCRCPGRKGFRRSG